MASEKTYVFTGTATVSVECRIEATSERKARAMLASGDCEWACDQVDGEVSDIELTEEIE